MIILSMDADARCLLARQRCLSDSGERRLRTQKTHARDGKEKHTLNDGREHRKRSHATERESALNDGCERPIIIPILISIIILLVILVVILVVTGVIIPRIISIIIPVVIPGVIS